MQIKIEKADNHEGHEGHEEKKDIFKSRSKACRGCAQIDADGKPEKRVTTKDTKSTKGKIRSNKSLQTKMKRESVVPAAAKRKAGTSTSLRLSAKAKTMHQAMQARLSCFFFVFFVSFVVTCF